MSSKETDLADRGQRQRQLEANLAQARAGTSRIRDMADVPAPDRDDQHRGGPNTGGRS
jgi:hypothetical protein